MCQPVPILWGSCSVLGRICKLDKQNEFPLQSTDSVNKDVEGQRQLDSWLPPRLRLSPHRHTPSSKPGELTPLLMKRVFVMYNERKRQDFLLRFNAGPLWASALQTHYKSYTQHLCKHSDTHITLGIHGKRGLKNTLTLEFNHFCWIHANGEWECIIHSLNRCDWFQASMSEKIQMQLGASRWPPAKEALCIDHRWGRCPDTWITALQEHNL